MRTLLADLRFALRLMVRDRAFALGTILTLALCVGANAAIFTVVRSVLYRPLPYPEPDRLVLLYDAFPGAGVPRAGTSIPNYIDRLAFKDVFESQALYRGRGLDVGTAGSAERVAALEVTPPFFRVLRVRPALGRDFTDAEGVIGQHHKAILAHGYAETLFGSAEKAPGRELRINGQPYEVIGVMPAGFQFEDPDVRVWIPRAFTNDERAEESRYSQSQDEIARLAPGATIPRAQARVDALNAASLDKAGSLKSMLMKAGYSTRIVGWGDEFVRDVKRPLELLWGGALFVLLIAAVNITNLVLVRATGRTRELATRHALGAGRGRVARQLLTETTLLTTIGAVLGTALGAAGVRWLLWIGMSDLPRGSEIAMDWVVVAFTIGIATVLGFATATVPLLHLAGMNVMLALREDGRTGTSGRGARLFRRALVVSQVALAFVLLVGAGLLLASFRQLLAVDPGFKPQHVLTARVNPPRVRYSDDVATRTFGLRALEGIRRLPGVQAAGIASSIPMSGNDSSSVIIAEGYTPPPGESVISPNFIVVSAGYFEAMGIGLVHGRFFTEADGPDAPLTIIIDERLAKRFWPNADPIGRRMLLPQSPQDLQGTPGPDARWMRVVGVVRTVKQQGLAGGRDERLGAFYMPFVQRPDRDMGFAVRTHGEPTAVVSGMRQIIAGLDPALPLFDVRTMTERVERSLGPRRTPMMLSLAFGGVALLLAAVGIYGVLAYQVSLRRREIGIRMALGSAPSGILRMVLSEGVVLVVTGLVLGGAGVLALRPVIASQLFGVTALDPVVTGAVILLLAGVAGIASLAPARRASRIDPVVALSGE